MSGSDRTGVLVASASATGATHARIGAGSDDAVAWTRVASPSATIAAIADGHSDPRCFRAKRGADLAVTAALEVGAGALRAEEFATAIVQRWCELVDLDIAADPLPDPRQSDRLPYGTTLLVCRVSEASVLLVQIGDGDIVVVHGSSGPSRPLADAHPDWTSTTDSLSAPGAASTARVAELRRRQGGTVVTLSTDGIDNAYPDRQALLRAGAELAQRIGSLGFLTATQDLLPWVEQAAATSGDDSTVAVLSLSGDHDSPWSAHAAQ